MTVTEKQIEAAAKAMFCQHYARELWENAVCRDKFLADARTALFAAEQAVLAAAPDPMLHEPKSAH